MPTSKINCAKAWFDRLYVLTVKTELLDSEDLFASDPFAFVVARELQAKKCTKLWVDPFSRFCYVALMDKTDPENELQTLANELTRANTHFHFAERLNVNRVNLGSANEFWDYTLNAHASIALLNLCRVYDYSDKGINLVNCLKSFDERALDPAQRNQLTDYVARCCRNSNDRLVVSLRTWRNNIIAHYNKEAALDRVGFDKDNPVEPDEMLLNLIETGFTILEWCSRLHDKAKTYQRLAPGKDSCEKVLECMTNSINRP